MRVHGKQFSQFKRNWFLIFEVLKFLQCYHQVFIVFHCLGYWNELASDWRQLFKVFSKEFVFFCCFEKMNDFKNAFGTSSCIKNKKMVALLTFEHLKTQQLLVFKHSAFFTMYFSFLTLVCICVFILESHYFRKFRAASNWRKGTCS